MTSVLLVLFACCTSPYEGQGIFNVVVVGDDYQLGEIKELDTFIAAHVGEPGGIIHYMLSIDPNVPLTDGDGNGMVAVIKIIVQGKAVATIPVLVERILDKKSGKCVETSIGWSTSAAVDSDSFCQVQIHPNTKRMATLKIPFSAAKSFYKTKDGTRKQVSFKELKKRIMAEHE